MFSGVKEERGSSFPWRVILSLSNFGLANLDAEKITGLPLNLLKYSQYNASVATK